MALGWTIGHKYFSDPNYDGYLLESVGCPAGNSSCGALPKGTRVGTYAFRNESLISWFIDELVGGPQGMGSEYIDGMYIDDVAGLGSPGTPDASPVFKESGLSAAEAAKWNAGQRRAVIGAQAAAVSKHNAFTWQNLQPVGLTGGSGMVSPNKASCLDGGPDMHTGRGFPGLRNLCSIGTASEGADAAGSGSGKLGWDIPLFMTVWADRNEMDHVLGHGSCSEKAD
eukprot:SAG22_NODE_3824_length_1513_cov_1.938472_1_plen_226_part_00